MGANSGLPLLHIDKFFLYIHEINERINEFAIGYIINPTLNVNKSFKDKVEKCMNNMFGTLTQPFIKNVMTKNNTCVLALIRFHNTRHTKVKKAFKVLNCFMYTIIDNFVFIDYLYFQ